jgi:biuret amidohydrolase
MELTPSRTALVAVHMQGDIIGPDGALGAAFAGQVAERDIVGKVGRLLDAARGSGATAVYTRVAWQPGYPDLVANCPLLDMVAQTRSLIEGSDNAQIVAELTPQHGDIVLTHQRVGAFTASQLDVILRSRGVHTVLLAGVSTNVSVESTGRQATDLGYRSVLVEDACCSTDLAAHQATVASMRLLGEVTTTDAVIEALAPAQPEPGSEG